VDAGTADVATLEVPPSTGGTPLLDVDVRFVVSAPAAGGWHELQVEIDGAMQWSRRAPTQCPGQSDSLDYHCRVECPAGKGLRVRGRTKVGGGSRRVQLTIEVTQAA
jgi:hypothetical protein